ncbi:MAG: hypothetical protein ACUVQG_08175 [Thermogutta sp.]
MGNICSFRENKPNTGNGFEVYPGFDRKEVKLLEVDYEEVVLG